MDLLIRWLASLFATFKAKNPAVAAIILFILGTAVATANNGVLFGIFPLSGWLQTAIEYVGLFLLAVTGSQTFKYTQKK